MPVPVPLCHVQWSWCSPAFCFPNRGGLAHLCAVRDFGCPTFRGFRKVGAMLMVSGDFPDVKLGFPLLVHPYGRVAHISSEVYRWRGAPFSISGGGPCLPGVGKRGTGLNVVNLPPDSALPCVFVKRVGLTSRKSRDAGHPKGIYFYFIWIVEQMWATRQCQDRKGGRADRQRQPQAVTATTSNSDTCKLTWHNEATSRGPVAQMDRAAVS